MRRVTIRDVTQRAGVSSSTVSRVLNDSASISQRTRQAVQEACQALHYVPDITARGLSGHKTHTIGIIVPDISNPYFSALCTAAEAGASARGYRAILCNTLYEPVNELDAIERMLSQRVDGLLVAAPERDDGRRIVIDGTSPILSCTLREDHYGVLTEVLVIDKTRNTTYTVRNQDMIDRGGQCRRVLYTPGQSTWAAMRYTGAYQIEKSRKGERTVTIQLPGNFLAFPGERVLVQLERMGISGEFRVTEADNLFSVNSGSTVTVTLEGV